MKPRPEPSASPWASRFVDDEDAYEPPPRFARTEGVRMHPVGTERAEMAAFVAATQAKARADAKRFLVLGLRAGFWAVVALVASFWFGAIFWLASVGLGGYALWMLQRSWVERRLSTLMVAVLFLTTSLPRTAIADSVYVREGGNGEIKISTSWGDFAAYDEGGGYYWIGTQREFDRSRVVGIAESQGNRLSTVNDDAEATFVSAKTYRTTVGDVHLDDIGPDIMFTVPRNPPRPAIPSGSRYVEMDWIQNAGSSPASVYLANAKTHVVITPYIEGRVSPGQFYVELAVPKRSLVDKEVFIFTIPGKLPGIVPLRSIAWAAYQIDVAQVNELKANGVAPDNEAIEQLRKLTMLDPSLSSNNHILSPGITYNFTDGKYPTHCTDPTSKNTVVIQQGDDFVVAKTSAADASNYTIVVRPEANGVTCSMDVDRLNRMSGASS